MRVLHLGKFYPPYPGGMERHLADLARSQAASGIDVAALVHASPGEASARWSDGGVRLQSARCLGQLMFAPVCPSWPLQLHRLWRDFRPDLVQVHVPNPSAFALLALPFARRVPSIVHWHADIPHDIRHPGLRLAYPFYARFERALNARAARVVATSRAYLDASVPLAAIRERCRVIPLGLLDDAAPAAPAPAWPSAGLRLLAVGRLSYYKGFAYLLEALVHCPGVSLLLVGDGELRPSLQRLVAELGLADRVRLAGRLDDAALDAAYRHCDLFCLPSIDRAEAFGMVLLEAMRAGKPVLASDIEGSGVGSVIVDGTTGRLVPPRDVEALSRALRELASDRPRLAAMGAAGHERWQRHYRIDAVTRAWTALYREVLESTTPAPTTPR